MSNFYNRKVWISICNYQKNLLLEQQYLFGQQKPLWTTEPTTSNTKLEEQPIEEINEYILTFTAFNLEIDWLLILLLYNRIVLTLISTVFCQIHLLKLCLTDTFVLKKCFRHIDPTQNGEHHLFVYRSYCITVSQNGSE